MTASPAQYSDDNSTFKSNFMHSVAHCLTVFIFYTLRLAAQNTENFNWIGQAKWIRHI